MFDYAILKSEVTYDERESSFPALINSKGIYLTSFGEYQFILNAGKNYYLANDINEKNTFYLLDKTGQKVESFEKLGTPKVVGNVIQFSESYQTYNLASKTFEERLNTNLSELEELKKSMIIDFNNGYSAREKAPDSIDEIANSMGTMYFNDHYLFGNPKSSLLTKDDMLYFNQSVAIAKNQFQYPVFISGHDTTKFNALNQTILNDFNEHISSRQVHQYTDNVISAYNYAYYYIEDHITRSPL